MSNELFPPRLTPRPRISAFMYLTDFRDNTLQDVIVSLEPEMFLAVTGLTVQDFHLLVRS